MNSFRNVSGHPDDLDDGRIVAAGEVFELDDEALASPYNKAKIDEGHFLAVEEPTEVPDSPDRKKLLARAKELNVEGNLARMRNDQLQTAINNAENPPPPGEEGAA